MSIRNQIQRSIISRRMYLSLSLHCKRRNAFIQQKLIKLRTRPPRSKIQTKINCEQEQQQQKQQDRIDNYQKFMPTKVDDVDHNQIYLEEGVEEPESESHQEEGQPVYEINQELFEEEQNQIEDQQHQQIEIQQTLQVQQKTQGMDITYWEDPPEYEMVKQWFTSYLGIKSADMGPLYGTNIYFDLPDDFIIRDISRQELEMKAWLLMSTIGASPSDLTKYVFKCPELFCLPVQTIKERLAFLLNELKVLPKRLNAYPQLLCMTQLQIVEKMKRYRLILTVDLNAVQKALKQGCRILLYNDSLAQQLADWLVDNGYPLKQAGTNILVKAPGALLLGPQRIAQLQEFLSIWGLKREEIKRIIVSHPQGITRDFRSREYIQKFVFLQEVVGFSVSRIIYAVPEMIYYPLQTHVAPRYYYVMQRGMRFKPGWERQLWRSSRQKFVNFDFLRKNSKVDYATFYQQWRMYDWPRIQNELQPSVDKYYELYDEYVDSFFSSSSQTPQQ
eukprot:TRINITY_DN26073_c0_g1_i2.p1 TRINITY_DN26073_c0_g1~~TRINITY_DN26073_c0_g1_i2.p1  ORF type:complete len:502 (-),score=45.11 TRINITY_DN26073_c0_g1_i2:557-2062(-)